MLCRGLRQGSLGLPLTASQIAGDSFCRQVQTHRKIGSHSKHHVPVECFFGLGHLSLWFMKQSFMGVGSKATPQKSDARKAHSEPEVNYGPSKGRGAAASG